MKHGLQNGPLKLSCNQEFTYLFKHIIYYWKAVKGQASGTSV